MECERKAKIKFENKITQKIKKNCKPFYSYLHNQQVLKTCVSSLSKADGTLTKSEEETAEVLENAFASVFVNEPQGPLQEECYTNINFGQCEEIGNIEINYLNVLQLLQNIDISKSSGPDNVHPKLLKSLSMSSNFVMAVTDLFKACASTGTIP